MDCTISFPIRWHRALRFAFMTAFLAFSVAVQATDLEVAGGPGGDLFRLQCPPGAYLSGFTGTTGAYIDQLGILCAEFDPATRRLGKALAIELSIAPPGLRNAGSIRAQARQESCPAQHLVVGGKFVFAGPDNSPLDEIEFECAPADDPRHSLPANVRAGLPSSGGRDGGWRSGIDLPDKKAHFLFCPADDPSTAEAAVGIQGAAGTHVASIGIICGPTPRAQAAQSEGILRLPFGRLR